MTQIKLTPQAEVNLLEIHRYIYADNPSAADRVLAAADDCFRRLARLPESGKLWASSNPLLADIRWTPLPHFPTYLVFYRASAAEILIITIIHAARDLATVLEQIS